MATQTTVVVTCDNHPDREALATYLIQKVTSKDTLEVDLCGPCIDMLENTTSSGRSTGKKQTPATNIAQAKSARRPAAETEAIRTWARENGIAVSGRGRIPASVEEQFRAACPPVPTQVRRNA